MAPPRLALVANSGEEEQREGEPGLLTFETDAVLSLVDLSPALAALLGIEAGAARGRALTSLFRLVEEEDGSMPLLAAVAARAAVEGQRAVPRSGGDEVTIDAEPLFNDHGRFAGFEARLRGQAVADGGPERGAAAFEESLDEALRSPLARIITAADHIAGRNDGPLRSDYATYAGDIAAAARHLLSVIRSMGQGAAGSAQQVDLAEVAREAAGLVQPASAARDVAITLEPVDAPLLVGGEARAIVQILVNIIGNAVRHSPPGGTVTVQFERGASEARISISDEGPGIAIDDQQRIFERYERVGSAPDGSGLGLAISRRLARSMGGDIRLESAAGEGARFTLVLPAA
jgi:signal transduction histidine kinase